MIFECDSQIVVEVVNGSCEPPVAIRNIVEGIQHKLKEFTEYKNLMFSGKEMILHTF